MSEKKPELRFPGDWIERHASGQKISVVTAYDASMARLAAQSGVDALLVGDSLGMVIQGKKSTLPVTLDEMIYHCRMVRRGAPKKFIIGDLPFGSYQTSVRDGVASAIQLLKETGVDAVKLEGATEETLEIIYRLTESGVPVMGHIGLTPQSYLVLNGFRSQGGSSSEAERLLAEAELLQEAGCFGMVLELVRVDVTTKITEQLQIPTIGIGSGPGASGQVLVLNDLLGLDPNFHPRHTKLYAELAEVVTSALNSYDSEVKSGQFPDESNSFK